MRTRAMVSLAAVVAAAQVSLAPVAQGAVTTARAGCPGTTTHGRGMVVYFLSAAKYQKQRAKAGLGDTLVDSTVHALIGGNNAGICAHLLAALPPADADNYLITLYFVGDKYVLCSEVKGTMAGADGMAMADERRGGLLVLDKNYKIVGMVGM